MGGLTYDSGALLGAAAGDRRVWQLHRRALERGHVPTVPTGVLGLVGPAVRTDALSWLLAGCRLEVLDEQRARACGLLLERAGASDVIAASVVVGALSRGDVVVTANAALLRRLARSIGHTLQLIAVTTD